MLSVSFSHYREFPHLSSQMGLRLTGTAGLSQPILGLSCCCWIPCSLAWKCKEASCRLGPQGSAAQAVVLKKLWTSWEKPKQFLFSPAGDRPAACSAEQRVTSQQAERKRVQCCVSSDCYCTDTTVKPRPCCTVLSVNLPWGDAGGDQSFDTIQPVYSVRKGTCTNMNTHHLSLSHTHIDIHSATG